MLLFWQVSLQVLRLIQLQFLLDAGSNACESILSDAAAGVSRWQRLSIDLKGKRSCECM